MNNEIHSPEDQLKTIKLFWDLFEMLSQSTAHDSGPSEDWLGESYRAYLSEQNLPSMSADELWHELHSKLYP